NSGRPVNPHFVREYVWMTSALLARRAAARVQKRFSRSASLGREFRDLGEDFRAEPELTGHLLPSLLKSGMLPDSIFNHRGIDQIVQAHIQGKGNYEHAIGLLISVGLAVKYFLHDDVSDVPSEIYASQDRESCCVRAWSPPLEGGLVFRILGGLVSPSGARGRLSILIYHRALPSPDPILHDSIDAAQFERHMALLAADFNVLPLSEACTRLSRGQLPARAVSITFDDGYADNESV